jgi:methionyl-tRNA formyltransferase
MKNNYLMGPFDRILLLGGGHLLLRLAIWAKDAGHNVRVITAPRHANEVANDAGDSLIDALNRANIDTVIVDKIDSEEAKIAVGNTEQTFALSFGAAWIFKKNTIDNIFGGKLLNLHGTRLPQNRGGGGFTWQILMGNRLGFCMLHVVDEGVDTGDIVAHEEFIYPASCRTPLEYAAYYQEKNYKFILALLNSTWGTQKTFSPLVQPEYLSTYWPRVHTPTHGWIDWGWSAAEIEKFICAFDDPYSGAQTLWCGKLVRLKKAIANYQDGYFHPAQAGLVYRTNQKWLCIACKDGAIIVEELLDEENKGIIESVKTGEAFVTPADYLQQLANRPVYSANNSTPTFLQRKS